jgi:hypothetical protein
LCSIGAVALPLVLASPAVGALPRTYAVQAIDNPTPSLGDRFGDGLVNGGDVDGDGEDDILVGIDEHGTVEGEVFVFSGENGALIRRIPPPDPDSGGSGDNPAAFGTFVGRIADVGGCPGFTGSPGADCTASAAQIDVPDGLPDHLASAVGVDVDAPGDDMGMAYVLDGRTGAVLKRMRMPAADRAEQAVNSPTASQGGAFGRTILSPSGQPPCAGFGGLATTCLYASGSAVARGDIDGAGRPDIGIGSSDYTDMEKDFTNPANAAANVACDDDGDPAALGSLTVTCFQTGRYYLYRGEDLVGLGPATPLETPLYTIKNPMAQPDLPTQNSRFHREALGYSVAPVGDLGACSTATLGPGQLCLNTANTTTPDGRPEIILSAHRTDTSGIGDSGLAFAIDGPTGRILDIYNHPEPQVSSIFAFSNYNQPAVGDLGSSTLPDVYQGAMIQNVQNRAQGRGYVLSGDFRAGGANHYLIAVLDDPTPSQIGNFGTSSAGIGDVSGDSRNEIAIGAYGPHAPQVIDNVESDVHIFAPLGEQVLQTIRDPARQPGSGFGRALAPLGDVNEDGFLDFVVGSGGYDPAADTTCSPCPPTTPAQGRLYILRSDNSPAPPAPAPTPPPAAVTLAGRTLELAPSRTRVRRRGLVRLRGVLEAFANKPSCERRQLVSLQRRSPTGRRYRTFARVRTDADGDFARRVRPQRTAIYRARVPQTARCLGAVSNRERITVTRRRR